jgi:hypothetical protein
VMMAMAMAMAACCEPWRPEELQRLAQEPVRCRCRGCRGSACRRACALFFHWAGCEEMRALSVAVCSIRSSGCTTGFVRTRSCDVVERASVSCSCVFPRLVALRRARATSTARAGHGLRPATAGRLASACAVYAHCVDGRRTLGHGGHGERWTRRASGVRGCVQAGRPRAEPGVEM